MSDVIEFRIKRRAAANGAGAPTSLLNAELAFNEATRTLYYGLGVGTGNNAAQVIAIGGDGAFVGVSGDQSVDGIKTFTSLPVIPTATVGDNSTNAASTAYVDRAVSAKSIADGDKGDITVSGGGVNWSIDNGVVTNAKLANVASGTFKGRNSANNGPVEDLTAADVRTMLGLSTMYQGLNANLSSLAGLTLAADRGLYSTGANTLALYTLTAGGRALGGASGAANTIPYFSAANTIANQSLTATGRAVMGAADAAAARTAIGAGVGSVTSVGLVTPVGFDNTGPITGSGNITISYASGYQGFTTAQATTIANLGSTYVQRTMMGANNGVATLDANGKLELNQLPALAVVDVFPVPNQAAMLALDAERGDMAIREDLEGATFVLRQEPATALANWIQITTPGAGVKSVNLSGGTTGLTVTGGPITSSGTFILAGTVALAHGGTGATNAAGARSNLGLGSIATQAANNVNITGGKIGGVILDGGFY